MNTEEQIFISNDDMEVQKVEIDQRAIEILSITSEIEEIKQIMNDLRMLVSDQNKVTDAIDQSLDLSASKISDGVKTLESTKVTSCILS